MEKKKPAKDQPTCHIFDYKKRKRHLIIEGKRRLVKKTDQKFRERPNKPQLPETAKENNND